MELLAAYFNEFFFSLYKYAMNVVLLTLRQPFINSSLFQLVPDRYWQSISYLARSRHALIVQMDKSGEIISTAHDMFGVAVSGVSHVSDDSDYLYIGSLYANYIARVPKESVS